jgi:hypothetical protein
MPESGADSALSGFDAADVFTTVEISAELIAAAELSPDLVAIVVALSDEREQWLTRLLDAERASYVTGYTDGYGDRMHAESRAWSLLPRQELPESLSLDELEARRSVLRGEQRTPATFAAPHAADFPGANGQRANA